MKRQIRRKRLVRALKHLPNEMKDHLEHNRRRGRAKLRRRDFVWHSLVEAQATLGSSRGYDGLIRDRSNYGRVTFDAVTAAAPSKRRAHLELALRRGKVRMPAKKAAWLADNFVTINGMGGLRAAKRKALAAPGRAGKIAFMKRFQGIGDKYARNIWMDAYHKDFRDSIGLDIRVRKVTAALGYTFKTYPEHEKFYQGIARAAALTTWEVDQLLYNYTDHFLAAIHRK